MPGTDAREAARTVIGELPDLPHLPELPDRGAGADIIGRTAALLVDLAVERARASNERVHDRGVAAQEELLGAAVTPSQPLDGEAIQLHSFSVTRTARHKVP